MALPTTFYHRLALPMLLLVLLLWPATREITTGVLADAFWQVAVFVAATLAVYHFFAQRYGDSSLARTLMAHSKTQVLASAVLGALPGCGGAIIVVTQFVRGQLSFGSVVAVLTATMGDAAFLLLASRPVDGIAVMVVGALVGVASGLVVDKLHGVDFMRPANSAETLVKECREVRVPRRYLKLWQMILFPAVGISLLMAMQLSPDEILNLPDGVFATAGVAACAVMVLMWALARDTGNYQQLVGEDTKPKPQHWMARVIIDTQFVTAWVVVAFLVFELTMAFTGADLSTLFAFWPALLPLMGVVVGLLPGCGPQIIVASLYIQGAIPFSAELGNAISNDGDALFPAIAMAPKTAIVATIYSTIPALLVAYGYYFLVEV